MVGKRPVEYWRKQLGHPRLSVRLYALKALAALGDAEWTLLFPSARRLPFVAWAVALSRDPIALARLRACDPVEGTPGPIHGGPPHGAPTAPSIA
ncbi:MAG: hypothetical protein AB1758_13625 [Candidatus Eremiobacterota bacterium]